MGATSLKPRVVPDVRRNQVILMAGGFSFSLSRAEALDLIRKIMRAFDSLLADEMGVDVEQVRHLTQLAENRSPVAGG